MEPLDIDWKNVESIFVKDDLYEHINAPKFVDFSAPEESIDDDAWFCRPDCRHPKNAEDFKITVKHLVSASAPEIAPLGDRNCRDANLKKRGIVPSQNPRSRNPLKNFSDDSENQNPNLSPQSSSNLPVAKSKVFKTTIKSSAEKKKKEATNPSDIVTDSPPVAEKPQLKSTNSARNLFAGREILIQITDFCRELKRLALNASERENPTRSDGIEIAPGCAKEEKKPLIEGEHKKNLNSKIFSPETWRKKKRIVDGNENTQASVTPDLSGGKHKGGKCPLQVRSCPPSPQHVSSPLKPTRSRTAARRGILQELQQTEKIDEENENISFSNTEVRSADMFWFLKPRTYLGK